MIMYFFTILALSEDVGKDDRRYITITFACTCNTLGWILFCSVNINLENLYKYSSRSICSILIGEQNRNHFCPCSVCAVNSLPKKAFSLKEIVLSSDYPYADSLPTVISISKAMCTCTLYPKVVAKSYPKSVSFLPTIFFRRETGFRKWDEVK